MWVISWPSIILEKTPKTTTTQAGEEVILEYVVGEGGSSHLRCWPRFMFFTLESAFDGAAEMPAWKRGRWKMTPWIDLTGT